jgi:phosphoserine phosphatase RsbU/P
MINPNSPSTDLRLNDSASDVATLLQSNPLFAETDFAVLKRVLDHARLLAMRPGDPLMRQGEASDAAYIVIEGSASVCVETSYGNVDLSVVSAPALVGEVGIFTGVPRTATVTATTPLRVLRIDGRDLQEFGRQNPRFLAAVMMQVGRRFQTFNQAVGFYSNALDALRQHEFDLRLLDDLRAPLPELFDFAQSFRRLAEELVERRTQREEMANAVAIQRTMLPPAAALLNCGDAFDLFAHSLPARDVGGDFYDYFLLDDRRIAITIGDVSGKGIPAALFMAATQTALRVALRQPQTLDTAIATANNLLVVNNDEAMFATLFCATIDIRSGVGWACNCGHPAPFVLRRDGSRDRIAPSSLPLGVQQDVAYKTEPMALHAGDMLFLWTDGLSDALNDAGESYGERRLEQLVSSLSTENANSAVLAAFDAVTEFAAGAPQFDDLTALAFIYHPTALPGPRIKTKAVGGSA